MTEFETVLHATHRRMQALATRSYLRCGFVPNELARMVAGTASLEAFLKYRPDQPHAPAGRPDGGQWVRDPASVIQDLLDEIHGYTEIDGARPQRSTPAWVGQSNELLRHFIANEENPKVDQRIVFGYDAINTRDGVALGRYQFRNGALQDLGLKDKNNRWRQDTGFYRTYKIVTDADFLKHPYAQEDVMTAYIALKN
jgi:hypothetical protein